MSNGFEKNIKVTQDFLDLMSTKADGCEPGPQHTTPCNYLQLFNIRKPETLLALLETSIPEAVAISLISCSIVKEMEEGAWAQRVQMLPLP